MDWQFTLVAIFGLLVVLLLTGLPVAFVFLMINFLGIFYFQGIVGFEQLIISLFGSLAHFTMVPIPMFVFMGAILFHSGLAMQVLDVLSKWLGRLPGRLSVLGIMSGTIFSNLTGSTIGNTAMLGTLLVPEMQKRGYKKLMTLGPIVGVGGLAMIIPPSTLAIVLGSIAEISVGRLLIGGILPGLLMAGLYVGYVVVMCSLQPSLAPSYEVRPTSWSERVVSLLRDALPLVFIVLMVLGTMFLGIATPTEAAALGAIGSAIVAAAYRRLNLDVMKKAVTTSVEITVMTLMIIAGSMAFSQILAFSGVTRNLVAVVSGLQVSPIFILAAMMLMLLFLGTFTEQISMMMITLPIFMPVVHALGFNTVWFGILMLVNIETGLLTPPFGMLCFVMKGVSPPGTTMGDIYKAALPFVLCNVIALALMIVFPIVVTYLPQLMS